ncbi:MAG: hypothetical protein ACK5MN_12760 [Lachnospiraceae bacterium]
MITAKEREVIRELARQVKDCAERPVMEQRREKWFAHNDLKSTEPVIAVFPEGSWREIITPGQLLCEDEEARKIEWLLRARLFRGNIIQDDIPVEKTWEVHKIITDTGWDAWNPNHKNAAFGNEDFRDNCLGSVPLVWKKDFSFEEKAMHFEPIINETGDIKRLKSPEVIYHEKESLELLKIHQELLGDILNVEFSGKKFLYFALMETYSDFRGLEQVMYDLYEEPEMVHEAMDIVEKGYHDLLDQYVAMDLLEINNRQGYNGSGGMNYTHDLPMADGGGRNLKNFWGFTESQEFTMVGPEMHYDFVMKHEQRITERFGLTSYGCCEPIENKLKYVLNFKNIRRISVSPWADIESCARQIGQKAVYSWKPNPSYYLNNYSPKDETFMEGYLKEMLTKTKDNCAEIVLKDTHTCQNDPERFSHWVKLTRRCIEESR